MASCAVMQRCVLGLALSHIFLAFTGEADYYEPNTGAAGVLENEYLPNNGGSNNGHYYSSEDGRTFDDDPDHIASKALLCFDDKSIYSGCEEAYRLSETGELHVPLEYTDQFCSGACAKETHLVLNCIEDIVSHFKFYNKATIEDVRKTIKEGCSFGSKRGNFNVEEHFQYDGSSSLLASNFMVHSLVFITITIAWCFLIVWQS